MTKKVLVIGLDSAGHQLGFDLWKDELPNLKKLMDNGAYGSKEEQNGSFR
ncbi:MAG: hypothetical protein ACE5J9_00950 [Methanosarcinales archaeon]